MKLTNKYILLICAAICFIYCIAVNVKAFGHKDIDFRIYKKGIYVVSIDADYFAKHSDVFVADGLETVENAAKKTNAEIAINAGFFDPNNEKTTSYILKNNEIVENPENNEGLTQNSELKPYLPVIFNRSEFRQLVCPEYVEEIVYDITNRNDAVPKECGIAYSVQAGPELLPELDLEKEFFVVKKSGTVIRESASCLHKVARSAIAIKNDRVLLIAVSNNNPMTIKELADFAKGLGAQKALAFDGGSSTSLYVNLPDVKLNINSAKDNGARRVKSVLIVK